MDLQKSLAFYKDRFADASDFTFVFAGSFDLAAIKPLVEQYLGSLPSLRPQGDLEGRRHPAAEGRRREDGAEGHRAEEPGGHRLHRADDVRPAAAGGARRARARAREPAAADAARGAARHLRRAGGRERVRTIPEPRLQRDDRLRLRPAADRGAGQVASSRRSRRSRRTGRPSRRWPTRARRCCASTRATWRRTTGWWRS